MEIARFVTKGRDIEELLAREWLLTNQRGSFASSTIVGCNVSGYHGLLVGSPDPLVSRMMALSNCDETIVWNGRPLRISTFEFHDRFAPEGWRHLREFRRGIGAEFHFHLKPVDLVKTVYLARDSDIVAVEYRFEEVREPIDFALRPLVALRDFHWLQRADAPFTQKSCDSGAIVRHEHVPGCELELGCSRLRFENDPQWWFDFVYRGTRDRGLPHIEDLWTPGFFRGWIEERSSVVLWARLGDSADGPVAPVDVEVIKRDLSRHQDDLVREAGVEGKAVKTLCLAADQFVAKRKGLTEEWTTIVAGFPWFADWGRDTFISLPGLLLATGRHDEAGAVLRTFAAAADRGMIPNRFDDRTGEAHFNSVDASLWFINAAFEYMEATGDAEMVTHDLLPVMRSIIDSYQAGTRFGIHADEDGLIMAGDASTQLTWMDAMCDGIAFTPRYGKAVEINALWHNALRRMQRFCEREKLAGGQRYGAMADQVGRSFCELFWNPQREYLNDAVLPDGAIDTALRPNQVFAVSLPFGPPLRRDQQYAIVDVVERELLTPYGLRTLGRRDPFYKAHYGGPPRHRDEAYHQGTVWPFLIGPFIEACLRVNKFSSQSKQRAAEMLEPLLRHLTDDACLGSISEVFDGDPPHRPGGCSAQAWSVAEVLRIHRMITG